MWSVYGDQYANARPESAMAEKSFREDTMSAAKGVYHLGSRATAAGAPGRKRRYFRQTDTSSIIGFPDVTAGSTGADPAEVVGSWQWGRPESERSEAKGVTTQKWQALAPAAFVGKSGVTAEQAVFDAVRREWGVVSTTTAELPHAESSEDADETKEGRVSPHSAVAAATFFPAITLAVLRTVCRGPILTAWLWLQRTKETPAAALVRHEAVAQLIAEGARLADLSPKTQRRLCRLRPLRMGD
jgi:hypothetical protein